MKSHDDYDIMVQLFIDNELAGEDREDLLAHCKECASCEQQLEEAKAFSGMVKYARPQIVASAALRERVLSHMANPTDRATSTPPTKPARFYRRPLAAAAIICIAVGGVLSISHLHRESRARDFVGSAIANHRNFGDDTPLDIRSSSPQVVATWFAQRVSFPFRIPNSGIASDDRAKYTLAGGRLVEFGGERAALLVFQMPNDRISLLVSSNKLANASGGKVVHSGGLSFHARDLDELHVATWDNKDLTYALVSSVAMGSGRSCSVCHKDTPESTAMMRGSPTVTGYAQPVSAGSLAWFNR